MVLRIHITLEIYRFKFINRSIEQYEVREVRKNYEGQLNSHANQRIPRRELENCRKNDV